MLLFQCVNADISRCFIFLMLPFCTLVKSFGLWPLQWHHVEFTWDTCRPLVGPHFTQKYSLCMKKKSKIYCHVSTSQWAVVDITFVQLKTATYPVKERERVLKTLVLWEISFIIVLWEKPQDIKTHASTPLLFWFWYLEESSWGGSPSLIYVIEGMRNYLLCPLTLTRLLSNDLSECHHVAKNLSPNA